MLINQSVCLDVRVDVCGCVCIETEGEGEGETYRKGEDLFAPSASSGQTDEVPDLTKRATFMLPDRFSSDRASVRTNPLLMYVRFLVGA